MANTLKFGNGEWYGKKDTILAYNDLNSNYKPLPFDFSRGSSATVVNKEGLIETVGSGEPRIDYKDDSNGALLLEPSRTNLWTNSNLSSSISLDGLTRTLNQSVSPSGDSDATLFNETATTGTHRFYRLDIPSTSTDFSMSFFAKKNGINIIRIVAQGGAKFADFDLSLGTVSNESGINSSAIEDYGNGWYRCVINVTAAGWLGLYALNDSSQNSYLGNVSKGVYIYGAQLEQGSYATSYIPTSGGVVTRVVDICNNSNIDILDLGNSYTLFLDADLNVNDNNKVFSVINNSNDVTSFTFRNNAGGIRLYNHIDGNYPIKGITSANNKFAIKVDGNSYKVFVQGSSLSGTLTTQRDLGYLNFYGQNTQLKINNFTIDNTALSDAECQALVN